MLRTKWEILSSRIETMEKELAEAKNYLAGLEATPCKLKCAGCDEWLTTEADFAKHFVIPDSRYLNLGDCPKSKRNK